MPDKKLIDNEIKKALECCSTYHDVRSCKNCPLDGKCEPNMLEQYALDLINRQDFKIHLLKKQVNEIQNANLIDFNATVGNYKAENKSLKAEVERLKAENKLLSRYEDYIKAEAYKEFAERLKEYTTQGFWETDAYVGAEQIDNLYKELVGDVGEK